MQIALDSARGLEYIHEHTVPVYIHRDIKSANILLDKKCHAKVTALHFFFFFFFESGANNSSSNEYVGHIHLYIAKLHAGNSQVFIFSGCRFWVSKTY